METIEGGRVGRKSAHGVWISGGQANGSKHGDEQRERQQIGQVRGDEGRGKGIARQTIVDGKAGARTGRGGLREREGRRRGRRW